MITQMRSRSSLRLWGALAVAAGTLYSTTAHAEVRHDGDWDDDEEVSIDLDQVPRSDAVKRLANAAGWSLVFDAPASFDLVTVHVKDQPAQKVLDLLLSNGRYVAQRDEKLISIKRADAVDGPPSGPVVLDIPPIPAIPPIPSVGPHHRHDADMDDDDDDRGNDRVITGGSLRIEKGEVVHDVSVMGGNVDVFGKATGDVAAMGGNVRIHKGAHVFGDASAVGGTLVVEDGARVDGDVGVFGGVLRRGKEAEIRGDIRTEREHGKRHRGRGEQVETAPPPPQLSPLQRVARDAGNALTRTALLFVFGAVLISLASTRMDALKLQIASRPMRTFATGVVSVIAAVALFVALCITLVGIPFAVVGALAGFFAACAGLSATLETVGGALLGHKTKNPHVHLAFGCVLFMIASAIPFVGPAITAIVALIGIGSVTATRGAGLLAKNRASGTPYRDAPIAV